MLYTNVLIKCMVELTVWPAGVARGWAGSLRSASRPPDRRAPSWAAWCSWHPPGSCAVSECPWSCWFVDLNPILPAQWYVLQVCSRVIPFNFIAFDNNLRGFCYLCCSLWWCCSSGAHAFVCKLQFASLNLIWLRVLSLAALIVALVVSSCSMLVALGCSSCLDCCSSCCAIAIAAAAVAAAVAAVHFSQILSLLVNTRGCSHGNYHVYPSSCAVVWSCPQCLLMICFSQLLMFAVARFSATFRCKLCKGKIEKK